MTQFSLFSNFYKTNCLTDPYKNGMPYRVSRWLSHSDSSSSEVSQSGGLFFSRCREIHQSLHSTLPCGKCHLATLLTKLTLTFCIGILRASSWTRGKQITWARDKIKGLCNLSKKKEQPQSRKKRKSFTKIN